MFKKNLWIVALLTALAMVFAGCGDGESKIPPPPPAEGDIDLTDAADIAKLLSATGWNGNAGADVSVSGNVAHFNIPSGGSTDNQGFRLNFPEGAVGYLRLEVTFKVVEVTTLEAGKNAKIGFKSAISPATEDVTPYPDHEIVFGTSATAMGVEKTQVFSLSQPNKLPNNVLFFSHNRYGDGDKQGSAPPVNYKLEITRFKLVGGEAEACCTDCDAECEDCEAGECTDNCYAAGDEDGDLTGKCCVPAQFKIDWTVFNAATGMTKEALGFEANWGGSEGVTTFNDEGKYITFNKTGSGLFSLALPAGTTANDVVVIQYVAVAEKGDPKLILKKNAGGTDLMGNNASWITGSIYPTLDVSKTSVLALDMSKVTDFAGLTKLSFQENISTGDKFNIKIISVTKEKLAGFNLTIAVSDTAPNTGVGAAATAAMSGSDVTFTWAADQSGRIGFIALTPGQEAVLMAAAKQGGSMKITIAGSTTDATADYRSCLGKVNVAANWNGTSWIGAAPDKFANIVGEKAITFGANAIGQIDSDNPGSRLQYLIIQARDGKASTVTVSSVKIDIVEPAPPAAE